MKTLKDLENVHDETLKHLIKEFKKGNVNKNIVTSTYFLRDEANKWVKYFESEDYFENIDAFSTSNPDEVARFLKYFFNINTRSLK